MRGRPGGEAVVRCGQARPALHDRDDDSGERAAGDVAGSKQHAGALIAFRDQLVMRQIVLFEFVPAQPAIDQPADHPADKNRGGRRERQINADRERERRNAAHLEHDRDHHA